MARKHKTFAWDAYLKEQSKTFSLPSLQAFSLSQIVPDQLSLEQASFIALDFETTGLNPEVDEIVSIGLVPFSLSRIRVSEAKHWIVRPSCQLKEDSIVLHGITHSEISDAPPIEDVLEQVLGHLAGKVVVVHYQFIEREFLCRAVEKLLGNELVFPVVDTMWLEAQHHRHGWRMALKKMLGGTLPSIRLADSRLRYGLPRYHSHNAMMDAIATAELLQAQIRHRFALQTPVAQLYV